VCRDGRECSFGQARAVVEVERGQMRTAGGERFDARVRDELAVGQRDGAKLPAAVESTRGMSDMSSQRKLLRWVPAQFGVRYSLT